MEAEIIRLARIAFPQAKSDIEALCLRIKQQERHSEERLSAMNTNAHLAQENERLRMKMALMVEATEAA